MALFMAQSMHAWRPAWQSQVVNPTISSDKIVQIGYFIINGVQSSSRATHKQIHFQMIMQSNGRRQVQYISFNTSGRDLPDISALALGHRTYVYIWQIPLLCYIKYKILVSYGTRHHIITTYVHI